MQEIVHNINLNLSQPNNFEYIHIMQGDYNTEKVIVTLFNGNKLYTVDAQKACLQGSTANGGLILQDDLEISTDKHQVTFEITKEMSSCTGELTCNIVFSSDNQKKSTFPFIIKNTADITGRTPVSVLTTISDYVDRAEKAASDAEKTLKDKADKDHKHTKSDITDFPTLGTASSKDVATSGNASSTQVVMGNDSRLTDARKASDVQAWAKASTKPSYTASEVGAYTKTETDTKLNGKANSFHTHGNGDITSLDASKITSGTISIDRLPQGALERLTVVADDTARFKLTSSTIQKGDTVKVTSTGKMYYVVDETKLSTEAGYEVYAAGTAASVPWSGVTGKPGSYTPSSHTHDDRYYTESETNTKLALKSDTSHNHNSVYSKLGHTHSGLSGAETTLSSGSESNAITTKTNANGIFGSSSYDNTSIRTAMDFAWYGTNWQIGNIRGSSTDSVGFGFAFNSGASGSKLTLKSYIDTNGVYRGKASTAGTADVAKSVAWGNVSGKPSSYTPSSHTHTKSQISDFPTSLPANGGNSSTVNGHSVNSDVPANAKFTDTDTWRPLGTTANTACAGNDSRLSNARPANGGTADTSKMSAKLQTYKSGSTTETYGSSYPVYAQWSSDGSKVDLKCDNYKVATDYAGLLSYQHDNEINFKGGQQQTCFFNYRNADTDTSGTSIDINYKFCNYTNSTSKTTITAGKFNGSILGIEKIIGKESCDNTSSYPHLKWTQFSNWFNLSPVCPDASKNGDVGENTNRLNAIYAKNLFSDSGSVSTSDRNLKHDINDLTDEQCKSIINGLHPKSFKFNNGQSGRTHYGIIAQDLEELLNTLGMNPDEFAPLIKVWPRNIVEKEVTTKDDEGNDITTIEKKMVEDRTQTPTYHVRYEEFIMILVKYCQNLKKKNTELEHKYNELTSTVNEILKKIN